MGEEHRRGADEREWTESSVDFARIAAKFVVKIGIDLGGYDFCHIGYAE